MKMLKTEIKKFEKMRDSIHDMIEYTENLMMTIEKKIEDEEFKNEPNDDKIDGLNDDLDAMSQVLDDLQSAHQSICDTLNF